MRVLIFTECGSQIGLGHISRCASLYEELESRGIEVELILFGNAMDIEIIKHKNYKFLDWLSVDFIKNFVKKDDYCIVDSYLADERLYRIIVDRACKCLFIDDNGRIQYPSGIVVNPSLSRTDLYSYLDADDYLIGPEYIILRKPFVQVDRVSLRPIVQEALITLGGSDIHNMMPRILRDICDRYPAILFHVIIGNAFNNIENIKAISRNNVWFHENVSAVEIKDIMLNCDLALTAAGQTIYELISTQTPFIPIKVIENQNNNVAGLLDFNLVETVLDYDSSDFWGALKVEFEKHLSPNTRNVSYNSCIGVIDGLGSKRIIDRLVDLRGA